MKKWSNLPATKHNMGFFTKVIAATKLSIHSIKEMEYDETAFE